MGSYKNNHDGVQRPTRSVQICLKADLVADWEAADRELKRAQDGQRSSDSKESNLGNLVDKVRALEAEMLEHTETWVLRAMSRHKFRALVAAYPPRKDEESGEVVDEDRMLGVNSDTFFNVLIRASVVTPELDDEDWAWLLGNDTDEDGVLTDRQFGNLTDAAWFLNRGEIDVPFSRAASRVNRDSDAE